MGIVAARRRLARWARRRSGRRSRWTRRLVRVDVEAQRLVRADTTTRYSRDWPGDSVVSSGTPSCRSGTVTAIESADAARLLRSFAPSYDLVEDVGAHDDAVLPVGTGGSSTPVSAPWYSRRRRARRCGSLDRAARRRGPRSRRSTGRPHRSSCRTHRSGHRCGRPTAGRTAVTAGRGAGDRSLSTTRSDGGGSSISTGSADGVELLRSAALSNTLPRRPCGRRDRSRRTRSSEPTRLARQAQVGGSS